MSCIALRANLSLIIPLEPTSPSPRLDDFYPHFGLNSSCFNLILWICPRKIVIFWDLANLNMKSSLSDLAFEFIQMPICPLIHRLYIQRLSSTSNGFISSVSVQSIHSSLPLNFSKHPFHQLQCNIDAGVVLYSKLCLPYLPPQKNTIPLCVPKLEKVYNYAGP